MNSPTTEHVAECAECGRTSPLTTTGNGTPKLWAYVADEQISLCPLHNFQPPAEWKDLIQTYSRADLEQLRGDTKPPPPPGAFDEEEQ